MKIFFHDGQGNILESFDLGPFYNTEKYVVQEEPPYVPKEGFYGTLRYVDGQLKWEYIPIDAEQDISSEQLSQMLEEVI